MTNPTAYRFRLNSALSAVALARSATVGTRCRLGEPKAEGFYRAQTAEMLTLAATLRRMATEVR